MKKLLLLAVLLFSSPLHAQSNRIGIIDFYGLRRLQPRDLVGALSLQIGDTLPLRPGLADRLRAIPGVADATVDVVCCEAGKAVVYVGVRESGSDALTFRDAPIGNARFPDQLMRDNEAYLNALFEGVRTGNNGEDDTAGFSVMQYPPARLAQQKLIAYAQAHAGEVEYVLLTSKDAEQRALAAQMIAYTPDRARVAKLLGDAVFDPASDVRNNAMRALAIMAMYKEAHADAPYVVDYQPLIRLLNSLVWTDRNKASFALAAITASRDPALLRLLHDSALDALVEMARWRTFGHSAPAGVVLARMAGIPENKVFEEFTRDREAVIRAASKR